MTKLSKAEAEQLFYQNAKRDGITLLGSYVSALTPVKGICPQGHNVSPAPNAIKKGQGWCLRCSELNRNKAKFEKHRQAFIDRAEQDGVELLGEYQGFHIPVLARCTNDHVCNPRPADIMSKGTGWCAACAWSEFKILYLVLGKLEGQWWGKVGRASREVRLKDHFRNGWKLYHRWDLEHNQVVSIEAEVKSMLRKLKLPSVSKQAMPQAGHTETFPVEYLPEVEFWIERSL